MALSEQDRIDIEIDRPEVTQKLKRHLDEVPGTIRSRILY